MFFSIKTTQFVTDFQYLWHYRNFKSLEKIIVSKTLDYSTLDLPQLVHFLEANDLVICK